MKNVILLSLFQGNGGIASWSKKFVKTFTSGEYKIIPIDRTVTGRKQEDWNVVRRAAAGLSQVKQILPAVKAAIQDNDAQLLHTTTSGSLGTWRDYCVGRLCRKLGVKCIMHCHYGCITEDLHRPLYGRFLRKTMAMYDQVWVLDNRSARAMRQYGELAVGLLFGRHRGLHGRRADAIHRHHEVVRVVFGRGEHCAQGHANAK